MGTVCCNIGYLVALMTFCDQQATGVNNTNVQRELGPLSQSKFNLVLVNLHSLWVIWLHLITGITNLVISWLS